LALNSIKATLVKRAQLLLLVTLSLALAFIYFQFQGFGEIIAQGYYFTGAESSITTSYLYVLVLLHLAHLSGGIIIVLYVLFKTLKGKYSKGNTLGFELAVTFWHFLDILWLYLFLFVSFYG
jgi:cytochrome c oxidase subunit 3